MMQTFDLFICPAADQILQHIPSWMLFLGLLYTWFQRMHGAYGDWLKKNWKGGLHHLHMRIHENKQLTKQNACMDCWAMKGCTHVVVGVAEGKVAVDMVG